MNPLKTGIWITIQIKEPWSGIRMWSGSPWKSSRLSLGPNYTLPKKLHQNPFITFLDILHTDTHIVTDLGCRQLRSADVHPCAVPRTQTRIGDRSFAVAGPRLWNNLPVELRQRDICLSEFRRLLKTFLFCWDSAPCDFLFKCAVYKYTYLLTYLLTYLQTARKR